MLSLRLPWRAAGRGGTRASSAPVVRNIDVALVWTIALLLLFGLVMVYSASIALPDSPRFANYKSTHFLVRHAFAISMGVAFGLLAFSVEMRLWQKLSLIHIPSPRDLSTSRMPSSA